MTKFVCAAALTLVLASALLPLRAQSALPAGWPNRLELGMADGPGGAAAMKATAPFGFRYQYLAGGVNTGSGWATWNTNGDFARFYIQDSVANGIIPVFTYYMLLQSAPGGAPKARQIYTNLNNAATMTAYYNDLKLFFQRAGAFPRKMVVLHVEPDLWGYVQQRGDERQRAEHLGGGVATGLPELAGLPSNVSGFARAIVKLRDTYAPNVVLGYHISVWGTGNDIVDSEPADATVDALGSRAAAFYSSLAANFDIAFAEFSDRDSAFNQHVYGDGGAPWWTPRTSAPRPRFLAGFRPTPPSASSCGRFRSATRRCARSTTRGPTIRTIAPSGCSTTQRAHTSTAIDAGSHRLPFRRRRRRNHVRVRRRTTTA